MRVRVALVGCGTVARVNHLPGLRGGGDADVVAFASRSRDSAERARDAWGSGDVSSDWRTVVIRDDVDAVHVCVPNALHAEVAAAALAAGKHVLVEKPITTTLADADVLLALAGEQLLGVAFDGRCNPALQELHRRMPELGRVHDAHVYFGHGGPQQWAPDATWFRDVALSGGGCLLDLGVHVFDLLRWCVGPVVEVRSAMLDGPVDERASLDVVLQGGALARVEVSWCADATELSLRFTGEHGTLCLSGTGLMRDGVVVEVPSVRLGTAAAAFARSVATGMPLVASGVDGRTALAAALAGYECALTRRSVVVA